MNIFNFNIRKSTKEQHEIEFPEIKSKYLIYHSENKFVVVIDNEFDIDWKTHPDFDKEILNNIKYSTKINEILNSIAFIETKPIGDWPRKNLLSIKRFLGEALVCAFKLDFKNSEYLLTIANSYINDKSPEISRFWALKSSSLFIMILLAIYIPLREFIETTNNGIVSYIEYILFGGLGSYFFTLIKLGNLKLRSDSGKWLHYINGISRIIIGMLSGLFMALLIESGILFSFAINNHLAILVFAFISGYSESFVPNIISKIENNNLNKEIQNGE